MTTPTRQRAQEPRGRCGGSDPAVHDRIQDPQATSQDKVVAVKFLVHLVGDIRSPPLHVGGVRIKVGTRSRCSGLAPQQSP